ncbi:fructose-specific PTS transporter subunit EIIC [Spiroplasma culicicola]|uniref:PTS system fructose-specific IIABC component n=1 Tax=Spiroplasma culicicola AES-1 TaxID=1276246 RepID=W6A626_9MOLU|nr:fructose-specific PTS transporter subunit EIIC [Spiroplasma culicicola]AHI52447.1 PTS system fructose-specific IIABC component [Spiroplasma culicicola AES-1]
MKILKKENVFLDVEIKSKQEMFDFIATKAVELKIVKDKQNLIDMFNKREQESSTAFEDGFSIPHAKISGIKNASIICVRSSKNLEWESLDGKPTNISIALIIPEDGAEEHLSVLSDIATKLMRDEIRKSLKEAKTSEDFVNALNAKVEKKATVKKTDKDLKIVAITACVVGVAHTYMAEDKLLEVLGAEGYNIRVETQGSKGVGTPLTKSEIDQADIVILATDTKVDTSRFVGKKLYSTHVARAIKEPLKVLKDALDNGKILASTTGEFSNENGVAKEREGVLKHILAGISYMIPIIILGGIMLAASIGIAKAIWGYDAGTKGPAIEFDPITGEAIAWKYPWNPLAIMEMIGGASFTLMIPILGGYIAYSIAGRAALAPAMVGAFIGNSASNFMPLPGMDNVTTPMGFIGAIIAGLLVGYYVRWVNTWNVPKSLRAAMPIFFIPITAGIGISILFIYVLGGPIGYVMQEFSLVIENAYTDPKFGVALGIGLGLLIGAMASFDMGGPINKIAFVTCSALITQGIAYPMGTMAAAIPVAPLGMGLTSLIFKRFFTKDEQGMGTAAVIMGTIGISEGAIPFAIRDPKRAIACNILGGMVAGAIAGAFKIEDFAAHGGPIVAFLGAVPYGWQTVVYFGAVAAGVTTIVLVYGLWLVASLGKVGSLKEAHVNMIEELINERNDEITKLKMEISNAKKTIKNSTVQSEIDSLNKLISTNMDEIKNIKEQFKIKVETAKTAYKSIKPEELNYLKANKENLKSFMDLQKQEKNAQLAELKNQKTQVFSSLNPLQKKEFNKNFIVSKEAIDINYTNNLYEKHVEMSSKFVNQYKNNLK